MSEDGVTQPGTRIDEELWQSFRADVERRHGTVRGHLRTELENALREYLNASNGGDTHDRLQRLESMVGKVQEDVERLSEGREAKNKKTSEPSATTLNRLDAIEMQIKQRAGDAQVVGASTIHRAIEDHAGTSGPTIRRYKQMLKERHIAFENPDGAATNWFLDAEIFVQHVEQNFPRRNDDIARQYGEGWYDDVLEEIRDDADGRTFQ